MAKKQSKTQSHCHLATILLQCSEKDCKQPVQFITCNYSLFLTIEILKATSTLTDSLFSSSDGALGVEAGRGGGGASPFSSPREDEEMLSTSKQIHLLSQHKS